MIDSFVIVKYRVKWVLCHCCNQKLPEPKISEIREFKINLDGVRRYVDWKSVAEYPEDFERIVEDFVYETIKFYALNTNDEVVLEKMEIEKVRAFIVNNILK